MNKKLISIILMLVLVVSVLSACVQPHSCQNVCPTCGMCTNLDCTENACKDKCNGHAPAHTCQNVCEICGKCTNQSCTESVCADKCLGHTPAHTCQSICPTCGKCLDTACTESACAEKCPGHTPPHSCQSVCSTCGKCTNQSCTEAVCANKCPGHASVQRTPVIFLAGDSTVKTYEQGQYIAGWGQFLSYFLGDDVVVKNAAHGGRSSRSFINEGRLYDIPGSSFSFSQNGGNSIGDEIQAGDYLFIQFGHNDDDTKKASSYSTMYDRMTPLGTPDTNGIYPTTAGQKVATTYLPEEYLDKATSAEESTALETIAKYGAEYYAYGNGTFKWYLKQYIDFARSKGAVPVLVTPVARVKFSGDQIIGGAGLHGENFAYVEAVRQLAQEENCLLIDLFADSKQMLETATSTYANYLMALKPNELTGSWPAGYDKAYGNADAGYTGIEATHYNKYGAYLQAAAIAEAILENSADYTFADKVLATPTTYVDPSNLIGKNTVAQLEGLFTKVSVTNPNRSYPDPAKVVEQIKALVDVSEITNDNYIQVGEQCEAIREAYNALNVDDRSAVTNLADLEKVEAKVAELVLANRPTPTKVVVYSMDDLQLEKYTEKVVEGGLTLVATADKAMDKKSKATTFTYNGITYENAYGLSVGGSAKFGQYRYVSFDVEGACSITIAVQSSGSSVRTLNLYDASGNVVGTYEAGTSLTVSTIDVEKAGTFSVGSAGSGMYIFTIIIEYFD